MTLLMLLSTWLYAEVPKTIPLPHIRGKELYDDLCFQCHGTAGLANTPLAQATKSPKLTGMYSDGEYSDGIKLVQEGKGIMPAYEMVIDKHDTKRILIYLSGLDSETGMDPRIKDESDTKPSTTETTKKDQQDKSKEGSSPKKSIVLPVPPSSSK